MFNHYFSYYWWVIICFLICGIFYERSRENHSRMFNQLSQSSQGLREEMNQAIIERERLQLEINSQSDPAWIEMTLVRKLGMLPGDSKKVMILHHSDIPSQE